MADEPFDYIGLPFNDTASVNTLVTEMNDTSGRWSYARQLYGHVYTAKTGTLSELVNAGDQFNQQHITLAGYEKETQTPCRRAGGKPYRPRSGVYPQRSGTSHADPVSWWVCCLRRRGNGSR
ncbi:phage tail sheath protein [Escherichia coli]|nr:phage tail sheath protein [Escherichia coli]